MTNSSIEYLRVKWCRLRLFRFSGSVLVDYRIIQNNKKIMSGAAV